MAVRYKRVLLKLSGEAFKGKLEYGIDPAFVSRFARQIKDVMMSGVGVGIVVGGGNIWRGATAEKMGMDRVTADYAGMLATVINALALEDALKKTGAEVITQSAINIPQVAEPYVRGQAQEDIKKGKAVIFAGGTGNPFITTDTTAALRALEIKAEVLLMAKNNVDGVYSADPLKDKAAKRFDRITHLEALDRRLEVMDTAALALCHEHSMPIIVFDLLAKRSIERAVSGEPIGTLVYRE